MAKGQREIGSNLPTKFVKMDGRTETERDIKGINIT